jgi:hypothetical protein
LAIAYFCRLKWPSYHRAWWIAVVACFVLAGLFAIQVLNRPLHSQRDRSPANPGGFSTGITSVFGVFLFETCLIIPAFPILIGLAFLPPHGWRTPAWVILIILCVLYVTILAWLIAQKHTKFVADFQRMRQLERSQGDQFRHLRRP